MVTLILLVSLLEHANAVGREAAAKKSQILNQPFSARTGSFDIDGVDYSIIMAFIIEAQFFRYNFRYICVGRSDLFGARSSDDHAQGWARLGTRLFDQL